MTLTAEPRSAADRGARVARAPAADRDHYPELEYIQVLYIAAADG